MTKDSDNFEVLVDLPGLTLVRDEGGMRFDVIPGFRSREDAIAILSEFGDVNWPDEADGGNGGFVASSP